MIDRPALGRAVARSRRAAATAARLGRNAPVVLSHAVRQLRDDPITAALLASRLAPRGVKERLYRVTLSAPGRRVPVLRALVMVDSGRRDEAMTLLKATAAGRGRSPRVQRRAAALALGTDAADTARAVIRELPREDPARPRLEALVASREGRLREAVAIAEAGTPHRAKDRRTARELRGELALLDPGWRPPPRRSGRPYRHLPPTEGRVLHLVTNSLPQHNEGYTVRTHEIVLAQRAAGLDPHVVTRLGFPVQQGAFAAARVDVVDGIRYHRLIPGRALPWPEDVALERNVDAAARLVRRLRPELLHAATKHVNGQVALALRDLFGLPVVYEVRGFLEETWLSRSGDRRVGSDRHELARAVETRCMREADHVVTLGEGMKAEIVGRGISPERVTVVPNCVDERFLRPLPPPADARDRLVAGTDDVVIGLVSSLVGYEGVDVLLRATRRLVDQGHPVRLLVVGDGLAAAELRALAEELDLGPRVLFTGRVPFAHVRRYHAAIDIFCVPRADTRVTRLVTPLKPLEAMASARTLVASDLPALAEIVEDGVTGVLAAAGDDEAWAEALRPLLYDPAARELLGTRAREWVARHRTWSTMLPRYLAAYESAKASVRAVARLSSNSTPTTPASTRHGAP